MVDKLTVELDEQFLKKFFGLTDRIIPEGETVTPLMLRQQLEEIEEAILTFKVSGQPTSADSNGTSNDIDNGFGDSDTYNDGGFNVAKKSILIIDDLGVITYQLSVVFRKMNFNVTTSNEIYDAIDKFKKQEFDFVLMDLFIPTEREGFILLEELKKAAATKRKVVKIGVMSASAKREHRQLCKIKGAAFYVEKADDWQNELSNIIKGTM